MRPGTLARWYALKNNLTEEIEDESFILDIGGYDGFVSHNLKKLLPGLQITVLDLDKKGLQTAKERGLNTLCASGLELPVKDNSIDVILFLSVIEHVREDDKLIKEISRVLKTGKKLILTTPGQRGVSFPFLSRRKNEMLQKNWGHVRNGYSLEELKKLLKGADLIIEKTYKYFNLVTRFFYRICFLSRIPLIGRNCLFRLITRLEPYIKLGAETNMVVAKKVKQ